MALTAEARRRLDVAMGTSQIEPDSASKEVADKLSGFDFDPDTSVLEIAGTIVATKDNATSFRMKGLQESSEGSAQVQTYGGIFTNSSFDTVGTLKTRASIGANLEMDLAFQSPHALLLIAQDGSQTDGVIKACSQNGVEFHCQYSAEELSPKRLLINRVSAAAKGSANTSDVTLGTNAGKLYLQSGHVDGGVVIAPYTDAERDALTPAAGEVIYNSDTNLLNLYNGTAWVSLDTSAV